MTENARIIIRECTTVDEFDGCVRLQREVFGLPDLEVSPRRHLIVSRQAGGWTLGAFDDDQLIGFVHHLVARRGAEIIGYSHMMAVHRAFQNRGIGAQLKWAQRARALAEGVRFIKWTWDPLQARNAHFNINRLGVVVRCYAVNFYGTDYNMPEGGRLDSDRLFAEWELESARVERARRGERTTPEAEPVAEIAIPNDWSALIRCDVERARGEQRRVRAAFADAFERGLICAGFVRDAERPRYLLYRADDVARLQ
ncbi:MAG: GNAT family N-acetyltransferase [Pyrinomonas sp.]|uniref:GNAT family N-acetyltransferase n=1 Tax=Pyrinomonas sp. TaxID=2080306 RepID=UPI003325529B